MSKVDYEEMTNSELRQYFLQHRNDQSAMQAYLDRLNKDSRKVIASPQDPDFDEKIRAAILKQLQS